MNRRNKNKAASSSSQSKQAQQPKQPPAKPSPLSRPTPPPPPKPTPCQLIRQEWQKFEIWLKARREEKDKKVSERINEIISPRGKGRFQKPATSAGTVDIAKFEAELNEKLVMDAREEWFRRLDAAGLDPDGWTDMTPEEIKAVEAAFIAPQPTSPQPAAYHANSSTPQKQYPSFGDEQAWYPSPPGAWDSPAAARTKGTSAGPQRAPPDDPPTHTPILVRTLFISACRESP